MRAIALVSVEQGANGRSVVRELRSQPPLTLVPRRARVSTVDGVAVVHMVGSATSPLGGDEVELRVRVGVGARLRLCGTAATVALPGQQAGHSSATVRMEVEPGGTVEYLPEATVVSARAEHRAEVRLDLGEGARARCRETLVLGRHGEQPGSLRSTTHVIRDGVPLLRQRLDIGEQRRQASPAYLAGSRVIASETVIWDRDPTEPSSGQWWSLVPLAQAGALATALADDAVIAERRLAEAIGHHPDAKALEVERW